ncbi:MAG: hypothetical protein SO178_01160 [Floccifex porci]|nr:hypothetical protein [Floccifex porci]
MGEYLIEKLNRFNLKLYVRTDSDIVNRGKTSTTGYRNIWM